MSPDDVAFTKGHGTGNDFVILNNLDGALDVSADLVAALCHRRTGIGADGVLIVARTAGHPEVGDQAAEAQVFMDYRNADGSTAQMCGNGARVFAAHLIETGVAESGQFQVATRGGVRAVTTHPDGTVTIGMAAAQFMDRDDIRVTPADADPNSGLAAVGVLLPNPHAVTWVADLDVAGDLDRAPRVSPSEAYPEGVNVEFVRRITDEHIELRVFERGVGETLSCGTGACAAAVATRRNAGHPADGTPVRVDVPGGTVAVTWHSDGTLDLHGPAQMVARGSIDRQWWEAHV